MQKKLLVLSVENFEMKDDKTGELIPSSKVLLAEKRNNDNRNRGLNVFDVYFMRERRECLKGIVAVPAYYDVEVDIELRGKRAYPRYQSFKFVTDFKDVF